MEWSGPELHGVAERRALAQHRLLADSQGTIQGVGSFQERHSTVKQGAGGLLSAPKSCETTINFQGDGQRRALT